MIIRCHIYGREFDKRSRRNQHVKDAHNTKEPEITTTPALGADKATDELPRAEQVLRRLLAYRVAGALLYADNGELQDNTAQPYIDFRRDSVDAIETKLGERTLAVIASVPMRYSHCHSTPSDPFKPVKCTECGHTAFEPRAAAPASVSGMPEPKLGEQWHIRYKGGKTLATVTIEKITANTVRILSGDFPSATRSRYTLSDLEFIEKIDPTGETK